MGHRFMSYTREANGIVIRNHKTVLIDANDVADYNLKENLIGWPEKCVFWKVMGDNSHVGIAPLTEEVEKTITHYSVLA